MTTNINTLGKTLVRNTVQMRSVNELTITQLAEATGVSRRTLGRIETAKRERRPYVPMLGTAVKLAAAAGVTVDELIREKLNFQ